MQLTDSTVKAKIIVGNDEKVFFNDDGTPTFLAPGKDTVLIVDIGTAPESPSIIVNLPLKTSMVSPPTNLVFDASSRARWGNWHQYDSTLTVVSWSHGFSVYRLPKCRTIPPLPEIR